MNRNKSFLAGYVECLLITFYWFFLGVECSGCPSVFLSWSWIWSTSSPLQLQQVPKQLLQGCTHNQLYQLFYQFVSWLCSVLWYWLHGGKTKQRCGECCSRRYVFFRKFISVHFYIQSYMNSQQVTLRLSISTSNCILNIL